MRVIVGGSRQLSRLSRDVQERLQKIADEGMTVLIGDANGGDRVVQDFFAKTGYQNLEVYCMNGQPRNNVGGWKVVGVSSDRASKDFQYYSQKDARMCEDADCGFLVWDGKSKGTLNNAMRLIEQGKKVRVYFSPEKTFHFLGGYTDLSELLRHCKREDVSNFDRTIKLDERIKSLATGMSFTYPDQHPA